MSTRFHLHVADIRGRLRSVKVSKCNNMYIIFLRSSSQNLVFIEIKLLIGRHKLLIKNNISEDKIINSFLIASAYNISITRYIFINIQLIISVL